MRSMVADRCLTRVVTDDCAVEVAQLQLVMRRIQDALHTVPERQRAYIANALLNVAVTRMVNEEGRAQAASILLRLGDAVANSTREPPPERPVDLTTTHG